MPKAPRLTAPHAESMLLRAGFVLLRSKGSRRINQARSIKVVVPFHAGVTLHPEIVKEFRDTIAVLPKTHAASHSPSGDRALSPSQEKAARPGVAFEWLHQASKDLRAVG